MQKYLINAVNTFRVNSVNDALKLREEIVNGKHGELTNFTYTTKYDKKNDEEYVVCKAKLEFNDVKEPMTDIAVTYDYEEEIVGKDFSNGEF